MVTENTDSFRIGTAFENYLEKKIFPKEYFDVLHKTHSYEQNSDRYVESSNNPDFKFRCKKTKRVFHVEAKFRSKYDSDQRVTVINLNQFARFSDLNQPECPVLIAIGIGSNPDDPDIISLMPLRETAHEKLYKSVLQKYKINTKKPLAIQQLDSFFKVENSASLPKENSTKNSFNISSLLQNNIFRSTIGLIIAASLILFFYFKFQKSGSDVYLKIQLQIDKYYQNMETGNVEALNYFVNPKVDHWFGSRNVNLQFIKDDSKKYFKKYPIRKVGIDWGSLKIIELPNNFYSVSYSMTYKIKSTANGEFSSYLLYINSIWNSDLKITSMYEDILKKH